MMKIASIATVALLAATGISHATTAGMNTSPLGSRQDPGVQFAYWDFFTQTQVNPPDGTTYTFNGAANESSTLTNLNLLQGAAHAVGAQGSGLLNGGDVYYSSTFAQSWTLNATASIDITAITFQIKTANVELGVVDQLYVPTLDGYGTATYVTATPVEGEVIFGFQPYVLEYTWSGLDISAGEALEITFSMAGGFTGDFTRKPVDFVSLDVATVPEPATVALLGLGGAAVLLGLRRRRDC